MTVEGDIKLYNHFKGLIDGDVKTGNSVRDQLIVSDAKKNLEDLMSKRPDTKFEVEDKEVKSKVKA